MEVTGVDAVASTASSNGSIPRPTLCEQKELSIEEQMLKSGET
jgi:hypothetical protein